MLQFLGQRLEPKMLMYTYIFCFVFFAIAYPFHQLGNPTRASLTDYSFTAYKLKGKHAMIIVPIF